LWTGAPIPAEYLELQLMRLLHCTPEELKRQDPQDILIILTCLEVEAEVNKKK
jgi:hypothetical protein